jgi:CBS domain-containing protein
MEVTASVSTLLNDKNPLVWTVAPRATVFEAIEIMAEKNVGALPVVDGGKLIGVISERDYTRNVILKGRSSKETSVQEIMTSNMVTARPGDDLAQCMKLMTEKRVRHLPVMDGEKMIGILSVGDLLKWIISAQDATIDQLTRYVFGESSQ